MQFIGRETVLYGAAALMGLVTIGYFGLEYIAGLSPFTISIVLFTAFAGLLSLGLNRQGNLESLSYILSVGAYIFGLSFTITAFSLGSTAVQFSLLGSTILFGAIAYGITQKELSLETHHLKIIVGSLAVVVLALVAFDVATQEVNIEFAVENDTVEYGEEIIVGEMNVDKPGVLPRDRTSMRVNGCIYNNTGEVAGTPGWFESSEQLGFGSVSNTHEVSLDIRNYDETGIEVGAELPLSVVEECPESADEASLKLVESQDFVKDLPDSLD